jgi:hypothetical protein
MPLHVMGARSRCGHPVARPRHDFPTDHRLERDACVDGGCYSFFMPSNMWIAPPGCANATTSCSECEVAHETERRDARYFAPVGPSVGKPVATIKEWT